MFCVIKDNDIMAAKECCVKDCPAKDAEDATYFKLPLNVERRQKWLKLIGRTDLIQECHSPRDYVVCSIHFDESDMTVLKKPRRKAIPTRCIPSKRNGLPIFCSNTASQTDFSSSEDDEDDCDDKIIVYKRITPNRKMFVCCDIDCDAKAIHYDEIDEEPTYSLNSSENKPSDSINLGNRKIYAFCEDDTEISKKDTYDITSTNEESPRCDKTDKSNNNEGSNVGPVITNVVSLNNQVNIFKNFFEWRCRTTDRRKGTKYDRRFKLFALNLHTINTSVYRILMDSLQLPKESELKDIQLNIEPKFDEQTMRLMGQKFKLLSSKGKFCTLGLYAMALKPHIYYDPANDNIIGVHNINGIKKRTAATHALIAMVRGLIVPWCQPVAYSFFSTLTDVDDINLFLANIVEKLKSMGLMILGVVMSDDCFFWKYCRTKHFIAVTKPYLRIGKDKLYVIFDIPHALNMFKDEFMNNDYMFEGKHVVSGKFVKQVYDIDEEKGGRLLPELTDAHMKVGNKEKNLEHSYQIFSKTVCQAIYFYTEHGLINDESMPTAYFIKKVSEIIDLMNNINKDKNNDARLKPVAAQNKAFENGLSIFKKLAKIVNDKNNDNPDADSLKYLLVSFKSLLHISSSLKDAQQNGIVQTKLTSLDPMLELIKSIKKDTKTNKPSSIKFARSFSKLFVKYLVDWTPPPTSMDNMDDFLKMANDVKDCYEIYSGNRIYLKHKDYRFTLPDTYAIIYVSSYLLYKCTEIHRCKVFEDFLKRLIDLNKTKVYVHFVNLNKEAVYYEKLKLPPIELPAYVERLDNYFLTCFNDFFNRNPAESIYHALENVPRWKPPCPCYPIEYMLKLFVRTRIYETILDNTRCLKNQSLHTPYTLKVTKL